MSKADPFVIFLPILAASLILPLLITDTDVSKINGVLLPDGVPKHIGFVPNKLFLAPKGARAGGAFVKQKIINPFLTAWSA